MNTTINILSAQKIISESDIAASVSDKGFHDYLPLNYINKK